MRGRSRATAVTIAMGTVLALAPAGPADAQFKRCAKGAKAQCAEVPVPLDRGGSVKGTVKLSAIRLPARKSPRAGTVLLLPGGPGQGASELLIAAVGLSLVMPNHDFVAFDPRGTGDSGRLRCKALARGRVSTAPARCAKELGARRGYYRSYDAAEDIEAVRVALGSPKLTLLSVSYGARVAGEYVRRHPDSVVRQVMDSPSSLAGTDPFSREVLASQPRVLNSLAPRSAAVVARVAAQLGRRSARGRVYTAKGRAKRAQVGQADLYGALVDGDLDPFLRGQIPAAAASALRGDPAPLLRLTAAKAAASEVETGVSIPLFLATSCSEAPLPWDSSQPTRSTARERQATAALRALGRRPFAPFSPLTVVRTSGLIGQCLGWPAVPKAPPIPAGAATSAVPTLVLAGAEDTRTPLEQSRAIASTYSSGRVLSIPYTGHSTLGTDISSCTLDATVSYLTRGTAPGRCPARRRPSATPVVAAFPRTLGSLPGSLRRRSIAAGPLTLSDAILQLSAGEATRVGGLRGGRAVVRKRVLHLLSYEFLDGVRVSGRIKISANGTASGQLRIRGGGSLRVLQTYRRARIASQAAGDPPAAAASITRWTPPRPAPKLRPRL